MTGTATDRPQPVDLPDGFVPHTGMAIEEAATYLAAHTYPDAEVLPCGVAEISWLARGTDAEVANGYFSGARTFLDFAGGPSYTGADANSIRELTRVLRPHFK